MGLFSKTATTSDVYDVIVAIKGSCLGEPGAQDAAERGLKTLRGRKDYVFAAALALAEIGALLKQGNEEHPDMRAGIESVVMAKIDPMTRNKSAAAASAMTELGRVFFLAGSPDELVALSVRQAHDPALTDAEREGNIMDLVTVAGGIAAVTSMEFGS